MRARATTIPSVFVEQEVQDGTAGAVALARPYVDQPVLIIFVDTIFDADLGIVKSIDADGIIWVKEVEDYQRFGVVVTDADGYMTQIVEKPKEPISKRANIGLYYIRNWKLLYEGIDHVLRSRPEQGRVVPHRRVPVHDRQGREDQGRRRRGLVRRGTARDAARDEPHDAREGTCANASMRWRASATIVEPVYIEDGCTIENSTVGPNVSLGAGSNVYATVASPMR